MTNKLTFNNAQLWVIYDLTRPSWRIWKSLFKEKSSGRTKQELIIVRRLLIVTHAKYHGLLVIPVPNIDDENHVLLSSLDETVIQHGAEFNLGLHKYQGNNFSPNGHKYIREFDCEHIPATTYRVEVLSSAKKKIFVHHENRILIRYTLLDAHSGYDFALPPVPRFQECTWVHTWKCAGKPRVSTCGKWY